MAAPQAPPPSRRGATVVSIRILGFGYILLGGALLAMLAWELAAHGLSTSPDDGGTLAAWTGLTGLVVIPALAMAGLGAGLMRLDRAAWVGQVAAGVVVPSGCALLVAGGLGVGAWAWILPMVGGAHLVSLPLLLRQGARWCFGIGPDAVLAEIDAREEVGVSQLAQRFRVAPAVVEALLERVIAQGAFAGAWDREARRVYSVDTLLAREALRRCPRCGAAVDALGNVARCPYCTTEFAHLTGLDYPMPAPIGVAVLAALDRTLGYAAIFLALMWSAIFVGWHMRPTEGADLGLTWLLFGGGPLLLAWAAFQVGRRLEAGQRAGWLGQMVLQPLAIPYLLRRRVRTLYSSALQPLQARLASDGELSMEDLAAHMGIPRHRADDAAIYLSASGALDVVLDWQQGRLLRRDRLGVDGRDRCQSCGAPLRVGGLCAFCGTPAPREPSGHGSASASARRAPSSERTWRVAANALRAGTLGVSVLALVAMRPDPGTTTPPSTAAAPPAPTARAQGVDARFVSVDDYEPARQEVAWVSGGITFLGFTPSGQLLSGEQNGLFVWDGATRRRVLRTPPGAMYAGVRWVGHVPGTDELLFRPYHHALVRGDTRAWRVTERIDFNRVSRAVQAAERAPHPPAVAAVAVQPDGRALIALVGRGAHLHDARTGERVLDLSLPTAFDAQEIVLDRGARRVAVLARNTASREELVLIWDIATAQVIFSWRSALTSFQWAMSAGSSSGRLALSPDGSRLVSSGPGELRFWNVDERQLLRGMTDVVGHGPMAFAMSGEAFALAQTGPTEAIAKRIALFFVDADDIRYVGTFGAHDAELRALTFDPSGERLISGDAAGDVRFWDVSTLHGGNAGPASGEAER